MVSGEFGVLLAGRRLRFSPAGELLSFASPKESNQRKGDPASLPFGFPIWRTRAGAPPTRPGKAHKTCLVAELGQGSALIPPARAKSAALEGTKTCGPQLLIGHVRPLASAKKPLLCRRAAESIGERRGWLFEPARASSSPAPGDEQRREAEGRHGRGGLLFGYFFLATQEKVTRPQAKSEAAAWPVSPHLSKRLT